MPMPTHSTKLTLSQLAEREANVFALYPQVGRYFPAATAEEARKRLSRTIERGDGPGLLIGAPGTGKSLQLQILAAQYQQRFDVVLLAAARLCTRRALLQAILFELGLPYKLRDEGDVRLSLLDHLLSVQECPSGLLLLVDEAQALPVALLDELRMLTNLVRNGAPRVRLVLAGSSALEEAFAHPDLESFSQRLSARCYLSPMSRDETAQFIRAQIAAAGGSPDTLIASDAWAAVFEATDGVPRLINQLCDRTLFFAASNHRTRIDRQLVQEAWSDLQQLPAPWETPAASCDSPTVEFGGLADDSQFAGRSFNKTVATSQTTDLVAEDDSSYELQPLIDLPRTSRPSATVADPFTEKFDEEEVVLDNYAAWDNMFRRDMPRVENRRDPGFSTLVLAAIEAAPVSANNVTKLSTGQLRTETRGSMFFEAGESLDDLLPADAPAPAPTTHWPSLRIAVVSDSVVPDSLPEDEAATTPHTFGATAFDTLAAPVGRSARTNTPPDDELPILVIEDDTAPNSAKPRVRREEYRHLFSRLRSG